MKDYLPSNWPGDAMGGSDVMPDSGGGLHPMSSEGAIAETQAMGVSPSMLSEVTGALKASVANPVPTTKLDNISHWKHLLLYKVSPEIVAFLGARNMRVQYAHEESFSNDLNTDYYAVRIKRFPTMNGAVLTPAELIRHIRLEINSFVDTSSVSTGSTLFHPYEPMDATTWVSDNPLKTVLKIDINPDNASVCVTSVTASGWTFSTVETPDTGSHPVSGTRTFFIVARDDVYYFVNKGLDMYSTGMAGGFPTGGAVAYWGGNVLWTGIQKNVAEFINSLGGDAKVEPRYSERVEWQLVYRRYKSELERVFGQGAGSPGNSSFFD